MVKLLMHFTRRTTWGLSDFLALFVLLPLAGLWLLSPSIWPVVSWLDLSKVSVDDAVVGEELIVHIDRELHRSTAHGMYRVAVRAWPELTHQCGTGGYVQVAYDSSAQLNFEDDTAFTWWAWGPNGTCGDWQPSAGQYVMDTEHCWRRFSITRLACRTVRSNVFTVSEVTDQ